MNFITKRMTSIFKQGLVMQPKYSFGGNKDGEKKAPKDKGEKGKVEKPTDDKAKKGDKPTEKKK